MRLRIRYPKDSPPGNGMDSEEPDELKFKSGSVGGLAEQSADSTRKSNGFSWSPFGNTLAFDSPLSVSYL